MPNDPKWRTIARLSNQSISEVQAVYLQLLVSASMNPKRGWFQCTEEDIASALDLALQSVTNICNAMQGRVLDQEHLSGWEMRQPKREDNSAERVKNWRERNVTQRNAQDKDKEEEKDKELLSKPRSFSSAVEDIYSAYPRREGTLAAKKAIQNALDRIKADHDPSWLLERTQRYAEIRKGQDKQFTPLPATWFNQGRYEDESLEPKAKLQLLGNAPMPRFV